MQSQALKEYRWKNRIIILVSETANEKFDKQRDELLEKERELEDRDLILLVLNKRSFEFTFTEGVHIDQEKLKKELMIDTSFEGVVLIGKDGGVKMREAFHVRPQKIFDLIDSMPMRRAETKN